MFDTKQIFANEYQLDLQLVHFEGKETENERDVKVNCYDDINAEIKGNNVEIKFTRNVKCVLFDLVVVMVAKLNFNDQIQEKPTKADIEAGIINTSIMINAMSRLSLLISQITAAYGQEPIITGPRYLDIN